MPFFVNKSAFLLALPRIKDRVKAEANYPQVNDSLTDRSS